MVVGYLFIPNDHVMRKHAPHGFVEAAADCLVGHFELSPGFCVARFHAMHCSLEEVQCRCSRIRLEVSARTIALNGITPLRNFPLELRFREKGGLRQIDQHASSRGFDIPDVH
jgi:hypothetical protein